MPAHSPNPEDAQAVAHARSELERLSEAAVDASSMIYMLKAGFFGYAASEINLYTVGPVAQEVGWPELPVRIADLRRGGDVGWTRDTIEIAHAFVDSDTGANDELLLRLAAARSLPVISEDHGVLNQAEEHGLPYFNALMVLALVRIRNRITEDDYEECFELLRGVGHYGLDVLSFSRAVARAAPSEQHPS